MSQDTNCKNCGGTLKNQVCPYCGTDYRSALQYFTLPRVHCDAERYEVGMCIDPFDAVNMDREEVSRFIKSQMVQKLARMLVDHMTYSIRTNYESNTLEIKGTIAIAKKGSYYVD